MPTDAFTDATEPVAALVLSAEVVHTGTVQVTAGTVRIGKRVVTETRTVTVQVRREELYVEYTDAPDAPSVDLADSTDESAPNTGSQEPVLVLVLHEEIPEVVTRVVASERVSVFVDRVEGTETVSTDLRHEEVTLTTESAT